MIPVYCFLFQMRDEIRTEEFRPACNASLREGLIKKYPNELIQLFPQPNEFFSKIARFAEEGIILSIPGK